MADHALTRSGIEVRDLQGLEEFTAARDLLDRVWGRDQAAGHILAIEVLVALSHSGAQVTGGFRGGELVAATVAPLGRDDRGLFLHSHITAADPPGRGVGSAMKWHQRAWALERDIPRVRWTFDPLVRRNAYLNLNKLGARAVEFIENLYGEMADARNRGLPTDRLMVEWDLTGPRARAAADGRAAQPDVATLRGRGAAVVLHAADDDSPRIHRITDARQLLLQVPRDIEGLRQTDRDAARLWSDAIRATLGTAVRAGYRIAGVSRDGWFVLSAPVVDELAADRRPAPSDADEEPPS